VSTLLPVSFTFQPTPKVKISDKNVELLPD